MTNMVESDSANGVRTASTLLDMPPEVLNIILSYVLSLTKDVLAANTEEHDRRYNEYQRWLDDEDSNADEPVVDNNAHCDDQEQRRQPIHSGINGCVHDDRSVVDTCRGVSCLECNMRFVEKGQKHICELFATRCAHKRAKWYNCYPQVLATCKQLNHAGRQLLPVNKIVHVNYHYRDYHSDALACHVLDQPSITATLQNYPSLRYIDVWRVEVLIEIKRDDLEGLENFREQISTMTSVLQADVASLRSVSRMRGFIMKFDIFDESPEDTDLERRVYLDFFANQFRSVRAKNAMITSQTMDAEEIKKRIMKKEIMSNLRAYDLLNCKKRVLNLVNAITEASDSTQWEYSGFEGGWTFFPAQPRDLPAFSQFDALTKQLRDLSNVWLYWQYDAVVILVLSVLDILSQYVEKAISYVSNMNVQVQAVILKEEPQLAQGILSLQRSSKCEEAVLQLESLAETLKTIGSWVREMRLLKNIHQARKDMVMNDVEQHEVL